MYKKLFLVSPVLLIGLIVSLLVCGIVGLVILFMSLMHVQQEEIMGGQTDSITGQQYNVNVSQLGQNEIPKEYVKAYQDAGEKYGIPWTLIAAIHRVETNFGQDLNTSSTGAIGQTQFMKKSWLGWSWKGGTRLGDAAIPNGVLMNPSEISKYGGFGIDGDGDGKADPYNITDAMFSTANYLSQNGGSTGDLRGAVYQYNHAGWYVDRVYKYFNSYTSGYKAVATATPVSVSGSMKGSEAVEKAIETGSTLIGKSPYVWGGGRTKAAIAARQFDCSSFVRWAYESAGVNLGEMTSTTTDTIVKLGKPVSASEMKRGDLVWFDTYKVNGHIGIYLGNNQFLNDGSSKGVSVGDMNNPYWKKTFKGVVRRVVE